jgi:hypothetical protein
MRVVLATDNRHLPVVVVRCRGRKVEGEREKYCARGGSGEE